MGENQYIICHTERTRKEKITNCIQKVEIIQLTFLTRGFLISFSSLLNGKKKKVIKNEMKSKISYLYATG